jgi:hypothetical protein
MVEKSDKPRKLHLLSSGRLVIGILALASFWCLPVQPLFASSGPGPERGQILGDTEDKAILGTWTFTPFADAATFSPGGGVVFNSGAAPGVMFATGHGAWVRTGHGQYRLTTLTRMFDFTGNFLGSFKANVALTLNAAGSTLTGHIVYEQFGPKGNPLGSFSTDTTGTRFEVEPMP